MPDNSSLFESAFHEATGILVRDLSDAEVKPSPYINRLRSEEIILGCIQLGDINLLEEVIRSRIGNRNHVHVGTLSNNAVNQAHYLGVVAVTLSSRAAICGGVPESISMALGDSYIQHLDQLTKSQEVEVFYFDVFRGFCRLVHDYKTSKLSPPVHQCCDYMLMRMFTGITLQELSQVCHLSPNYISDLFRKELGMGAIQYFHSQKMDLAAYLLLNTELTVAEISAQLGYCSQSSFTQRFKSVFGRTPARYRSQQIQKFPGQINDVTDKILRSL